MQSATCTNSERPDLALPMSGTETNWAVSAKLTDLEFTALALLLKKITFEDVSRIMSRERDSDPHLFDPLHDAHDALMELDDALEQATEKTQQVML